MHDLKPLLALIFTMITWGLAPVVLRSQAVEIGAADSLIIRYTIVAAIYASMLLMAGNARIDRADWPRLLVISLIGMLGYNLGSMFGFEHAPAGIGGLIYSTQPLLIILLAAILLREHLSATAILGIIIAGIGTILLFWRDAGQSSATGSAVYGGGLLFLACMAWAVYSVVSRPLLARYGVLPVTAWSIIIATFPMYLLADTSTVTALTTMNARQWAELMFLAVLSTVIATLTWNFSVARLPAATTGAFLYLIPVIAIAAGALLLDEDVTLAMVIGGLLILLGVAVAQFRPRLSRPRHEKNAV
jgi:drug/metabolite transporter (DMT)-like permease